MKKLSRRQVLQVGLGASQLALLGALGARPRRASAGGDGLDHPTRLLTMYVPGGWMPELFFTPLSRAQIGQAVPARETFLGEPTFFDADDVRNIDGSGDDPDENDPGLQRIRVPHHWDEAALQAGEVVTQDGVTTPLGWAWKHNDLYRRACVLHGIDAGTAAHLSGRVSMMCGVAGPKFRSPALHAFVASAFSERFPERPLPSVAIGSGPLPPAVSLGAEATPTLIGSTASLEGALSERSDLAWDGLRDRSEHPQFGFDSRAMQAPITSNNIDEFVLGRTRRLYGTVNSGTNAFFEEFYESYATVSKQLALDLVTELETTTGWENFVPTWARPSNGPGPYGVTYGLANGGDSGQQWADPMDLALKLFKADLASSVSLRIQGPGGFYFDTHDGENGARLNSVNVRATLEVIGRMLHEMEMTEVAPGKSLLDDTLVVVFSEFSRTWPGTACDHWPFTSVLYAGGGIAGNRQVGNFDLDVQSPSPIGVPIKMIDEGGDNIERPPRSGDMVFTALHALGIEDVFIPGGVADVTGVRA